MAGVNKVILLGNLGADPEIRSLPSGMKVATFNIATSDSYNNKDGVRVEQTEWHRIELWDTLANLSEQYLHKGDSVYIEGKIRSEEYVDKDNITRRVTKVRGTNITLLPNNRRDNQEGGSAPAPQAQAPRPAPAQTAPSAPEFDTNAGGEGGDDLPF